MDRPPIYIPPDPPGMPVPTGETQPDALLFFRLYGGLMVLVHFLLLCVGAFLLAATAVAKLHASGGT